MEADNVLTGALRQLFAVAEAYPDLKANTNFTQLQSTLEDTENKVSYARQSYNDCVLSYNNAIQTFPAVIFAGIFQFKERQGFEAAEAARQEEERLAAEAAAAKRAEQVTAAQAEHDSVQYGDKLGRIWVEGTNVDCALYWGDSEGQFGRGAGCRAESDCVLPGENGTVFIGGRSYGYVLLGPWLDAARCHHSSGDRLGRLYL